MEIQGSPVVAHPVRVLLESQLAIDILNNPRYHPRSKRAARIRLGLTSLQNMQVWQLFDITKSYRECVNFEFWGGAICMI